jgi:hypothetical protein
MPVEARADWAIALHGGAVDKYADMSAAQAADYRKGLSAAFPAGSPVLQKGGAAFDSAEAAIRVLAEIFFDRVLHEIGFSLRFELGLDPKPSLSARRVANEFHGPQRTPKHLSLHGPSLRQD